MTGDRLDSAAGRPSPDFPAGVLDEADEALDRAALFLTQRIRAAGATAASA